MTDWYSQSTFHFHARSSRLAIYLYAKNSAARFITILAPSARFIIILALKALFFSQFWRLSALFKEPKALFIINFGAEGALYCQRRFVNTLCIVL